MTDVGANTPGERRMSGRSRTAAQSQYRTLGMD